MNEQAASLAALNVSLLEAIKAGPYASRKDLCEAAGVLENNIARKLTSLTEAGLITETSQPRLTEEGERALAAMAVFRGELPPAPGAGVTYIPFDRIEPWILNPRTQFDDASIEDMAQSVTDKGILQPLTVRAKGDRFEVIIGERRRRGATRAVERGWVSADFLVPCQVKAYDDDEALDVAGVENLQRQDLHWMDEAKFYLRLAERGRSGSEIARLAGESVSKRKVQDYCKIARELAPKDVERCYLPDGAEGQLTYTKARDLVGEKAAKLPLELTPPLALAFGELILAASVPGQDYRHVRELEAEIFADPRGGPIEKLVQKKLVTTGFTNRQMVARIAVTDEVRAWLLLTGLDAEGGAIPEPEAAHRKLLEPVVGPLVANTWPAETFHTTELRRPAALSQAAAPALTDDQRRKLVEIAHKAAANGDPNDFYAYLGNAAYIDPAAAKDPDFTALMEQGYIDDEAGDFGIMLTEKGAKFLEAEGLGPDGTLDCRALATVYAACNLHPPGETNDLQGHPYHSLWMLCQPPAEHDEADEQDVQADAERKPAPDPLTATQRRILREIAARSVNEYGPRLGVDCYVSAHPDALNDPDLLTLDQLQLASFVRNRTNNDMFPKGFCVTLDRPGVEHMKAHGYTPTQGKSANSCATPWLRQDYKPGSPTPEGESESDEPPAYLRALAGPGAPAPAPAAKPAPPPAPALPELPPMLAIVVVEAAHKIANEGMERGPGTWGAVILADFHKDRRGQDLVFKKMIAFMGMGERQLVTVTKTGLAWLEAEQGILSEDGRPMVSDQMLRDAQTAFVGKAQEDRTYNTTWLNKPAASPAPETPPAAQPAEALADGPRNAADAAPDPSAPLRLNPVQRALLAAYGELGQLDSLLGRLRGGATVAHKAEIDQHRRLIEAIRETGKASLPEGVING